MIEIEKNLKKLLIMLKQYCKDEITIKYLKENFLYGDNEKIKIIKIGLEKAYHNKDYHEVDLFVMSIFCFELYSKEFIDILCKLSKEEWHYKHEDIANIFQYIGSPNTVDCVYELAISNFEKYRWDDNFALVGKCCYALGKIGTLKAKRKLELLLKSDEEIVRNYVSDVFEIYDFS